MKTIKNEEYRGYSISIEGQFIEESKVLKYSGVYFDSVKLTLKVAKSFRYPIFTETATIEEDRAEKGTLYKGVKQSIDKLIDKAKAVVDKKIREEEITNGLPDSLLTEEKEPAKEESINITFNISNINGDASSAERISQRISEALGRNKGVL